MNETLQNCVPGFAVPVLQTVRDSSLADVLGKDFSQTSSGYHNTKLKIKWVNGNDLLINSIRPASVSTSAKSESNPISKGSSASVSSVHRIRWAEMSSTERVLAVSTRRAFAGLQSARAVREQGRGEGNWWEHVLVYSRYISKAFTEALGHCSNPLGTLVPTHEGVEAELRLQSCIWDLLEIFFVNQGAVDGVVTEDLVAWLRSHHLVLCHPTHSPPALQAGVLVEQASAGVDRRPAEECGAYWEAVWSLTAVGWVEHASDLLGMHSVNQLPTDSQYSLNLHPAVQKQREAVESAIALLTRMPRMQASRSEGVDPLAYASAVEFLRHRERWREQCTLVLTNQDIWTGCPEGTCVGVQTLVRILLGDEHVLDRTCHTWAELLVAELLHVHPTLQVLSDIHSLTTLCINRKPPTNSQASSGALEGLVEAVMSREQSEVLRLSSQHFNAWFLAHLHELLPQAPHQVLSWGGGGDGMELEVSSEREGLHLATVKARTYYLLEYSNTLASHPSLCTLLPDYLAALHDPTNPNISKVVGEILEQALGCVGPETSSRDAMKVWLRLEGLDECRGRVARQLGRLCLRKGATLQGLQWLCKGQDHRALQAVMSEGLMERMGGQEVVEAGGIPPPPSQDTVLHLSRLVGCLVEVDGLKDSPQICTFIHKYCSFRQILQDIFGSGPPSELPSEGDSWPASYYAAKELVLELMRFKRIPRQFWLVVIFEACPLLEVDHPPVFLHHETQELLGKLQGLVASSPSSPKNTFSESHARLQVVHIALTRSLSRSYLHSMESRPERLSHTKFCVY